VKLARTKHALIWSGSSGCAAIIRPPHTLRDFPSSGDEDDPIWAHRLALKLEWDLDERLELSGGCSQGFEQGVNRTLERQP
jgi:hypothetical protein